MRERGKDLYQILNVDPTADLETIRVAYRNLAKRYHPDIYPSPDAKARMQEINDAYRTLSNPSKRVWYDNARERERVRRRAYRRPQPSRQDWRRTHTPPRGERPRPHSDRPPRTRSGSSGIPFWWLWLLVPMLSFMSNFTRNFNTNYRSNPQRPTPTVMRVHYDQDSTAEIVLEIPDWPIVIEEDFDTNKVPLLKGSFKDQNISGSRFILDGTYHWEISVNDQTYFDTVYYSESFSDFYLAVDVQKLRGHRASSYGVMFRCPNSYDGYLFYVSNRGYFRVLVLDSNEWVPLINSTYSSAIKSIDTNRLAVIAIGPHYDFYINGEHVGDLTDTRFDTGKVGFAVGFEEKATGEYTFDNFVVRQPHGTIEERTPYPTRTPKTVPSVDSIRQLYWNNSDHLIDEM